MNATRHAAQTQPPATPPFRPAPVRVNAHDSAGVTLIELMITVAIVAILAAIAFPAYNRYTISSNRSEAQQFMMDVASREEEYLLNNRDYETTLTTLYAAGSDPTPARVQSFYTITVTKTASPPAYTITATPKTGTRQVSDGTLTYQSDGVKTPSNKW